MRKKLKPFFIGVVLILAIGTISAALIMHNANEELDRIVGLHQMDGMRRGVLDSFWSVYKVILEAERLREQDIDTIIASIERMHSSTNACLTCHQDDLVVDRITKLDKKMSTFEQTLSFLITTSANAHRIDRLGIEAAQNGSDVLQSVEELQLLANNQMKRSVATIIGRLHYASYIFYATLVVISAFGIILSLVLVRSITKPINKLIDGTRMIAGGKLGFRIEEMGNDEFGELAGHFNKMSEELNSTYIDLENSNRNLTTEIEEHQKAARERQQLFEELIQARKMEAVGTLAGGIAHEFNNLLQAIQISAEFMSATGGHDEKVSKHMGIILNASARGADLTKRLLTFSRRVEGEMGPLNLTETAEQLTHILRENIPQTITLDLLVEPRPIWVLGDLTAIEKIFIDLVLNARDAMPGGGTITLRITTPPAEEAPEGIKLPNNANGLAKIEVSDTGLGMDEETRQKIFEPFFTTKSVGFGTGLGLAITYGVVQSHSGHIVCTSEIGKGTTFIIWLPIIQPLKVLG